MVATMSNPIHTVGLREVCSAALVSLYLYKTNCHQSLSQIFACCLGAAGKAALPSDGGTAGRSWLIAAQHSESHVYLIVGSFRNPSEQEGMMLLSCRSWAALCSHVFSVFLSVIGIREHKEVQFLEEKSCSVFH